ncbi:hypothetical protein CL634_08280 [bacterium]|nr:hypothetical protein [bacterium]
MIEWFIIITLSGLLILGASYVRYLIKQIKNISDDFVVVRAVLLEYNESLKSVYETEMFYGEPILQTLVEETRELTVQLKNIIEDYDYDDLDLLEAEDINEKA